jgi:hypothetical protein
MVARRAPRLTGIWLVLDPRSTDAFASKGAP